jgi:hypothetical protein
LLEKTHGGIKNDASAAAKGAKYLHRQSGETHDMAMGGHFRNYTMLPARKASTPAPPFPLALRGPRSILVRGIGGSLLQAAFLVE